MERRPGLDRRTFLRGAGASVLLSAAGMQRAVAETRTPIAFPPGPQVHDFDEIYNRVGTDCVKWDSAIADYGSGIEVGMGIADLDFRTPSCIKEALNERCEHENWGYLRRPAAYTQAVVDWNQRRYGLEIDPANVVFTTGVHPGIIAALHTFAPPGTRVLLTSPTYNGFYSDLRFTRTVAEDSEMIVKDGRYSIDFDDFERRAQRANVFILCNPQNPTGNCWSPEDMTRMGEICLRHRVVVLSDEIHCDFVQEGQTYTPFAALPNRDIVDNSLTFKAASKTFGLAAMKVAWYFSTNQDYLERVKTNTRADLSTLGLVANHAALTEGEVWLDELLPYLDGNHSFVESYVQERVPYVKYTKAQGTYLAWLDVGELADRIGAEDLAARETRSGSAIVTAETIVQRWVAENAGVFLNPGHSYGTGGAAHMRMNVGTSRRLIQLALDNMADAVSRV